MNRPFTIGLTGVIGSGKSSVADMLRNLGAEVVSGDQLGREVLEENRGLQADLLTRWGNQILEPDGKLNRRRIGELVFASAEDARWLTEQTFPGIHTKWRDAVGRTRARVIVFDAAMIFEWGIEREFDVLVSVTCDAETAISRSAGRFTREEYLSRRSLQVAERLKVEKSHHVIENNGTIEELRNKVKELWERTITSQL